MTDLPTHPTIARVWRGRTTRACADEYEMYNYEVGIKPLIEKALGVQTFREDRETETEFQLTGLNWEIYGHWQTEWNADPSGIRTDVFYQVVPAGWSSE